MLTGIGATLYHAQNVLARLLGTAEFFAKLTHSLVLNRGTGSPTFTRASTATVTNNDGYLVQALSGEARFEGVRRIDNLIRLGAAQSSTLAVAANVTMTLAAGKYVFSMGVGTGTATFSGTGGATGTLNANAISRSEVSKTITAGTLIVTASVATLTDIQVESVDAQTTQTAGEYVSVGALDYRSDKDPLFLSLPGTHTYYASAPGASATTNIDVRVLCALDDWTPIASNCLLSKLNDIGANRSFLLWVNPDGTLRIYWDRASDHTQRSIVSSVAPTVTNGTYLWVRFTRVDSTGVFTFYTCPAAVADPVESEWVQLGGTTTWDAGEATATSTEGWAVGSYNAGFGAPAAGKFRRALVYDNSTLVVDFNPHRDAVTPTGTITSSTTSEVWTINGASSVIRNAAYHGSNVDGVKYFSTDIAGNPIAPSGILVEGSRENLCLQSNAFTTTWVGTGAITPVQDVVGPDGATSAWTLTDNDAGSYEDISQAITLTAATHTFSGFIKKTTGAQSSYPLLFAFDGATRIALCTVDTTNGVATAWTAYTGLTVQTSSANCVGHNSDYWRVSLTFLATAALWTHFLVPAATANATQSTGVLDVTAQGSAVFYGAQVELGSFASTYIPTTTAAVTRAASVDSYPTSGNITAAAGTVALTYTPTHAPSGTIALWGTYVDASNYTAILHDATNLIFRKRIAGSNYDATIANAFVADTAYTVAASWGAEGTTITLDGTEGTPHANTTAAQIAATMQIGADGNGAQQPFAAIKNERIWQRQLSASERIVITGPLDAEYLLSTPIDSAVVIAAGAPAYSVGAVEIDSVVAGDGSVAIISSWRLT